MVGIDSSNLFLPVTFNRPEVENINKKKGIFNVLISQSLTFRNLKENANSLTETSCMNFKS